MNNNNLQKAGQQSAAARLARLPLVRSACSAVSLLYADAKRLHPGVTAACAALEGRVAAACVSVSPVMEKLEPHVSVVNGVACRSLDWLEASFPVLLSPTDQVLASAKDRLHGLQEAVQHRLMWVVTQDGATRSLVERVFAVADVGLDSALSFSEALLDQVLPPEGDEGIDKTSVEGFEVTKVPKTYPGRAVTLAATLCRRTYCVVGARVQAMEEPPSPPAVTASRRTPTWRLQELPEYLQRQAFSVMCFVFHLYHLVFCASQQVESRRRLNAQTPSPPPDPARGAGAWSTGRRLRPSRLSVFDDGGCNKDGGFEGRLSS